METWSPVPEASWSAMGQLVAVSQDTERLKRTQGDGARAALSQQLAGRDPGCVGEMTRPHLMMPSTDSRCLRWSMTKWHTTGGVSFQGSHLSPTQARLAWEGSAGHSTPWAPHPLANGSTPCCEGARFSPAGSQPRDFSQEATAGTVAVFLSGWHRVTPRTDAGTGGTAWLLQGDLALPGEAALGLLHTSMRPGEKGQVCPFMFQLCWLPRQLQAGRAKSRLLGQQGSGWH